jgi:hypothetical protein
MSKVTDIVGTSTNQEPIKDAEILALEKEALRLANLNAELEIKLKRANIQDLEESLAERELKRETKRQRSLTNGQTLLQLEANDKQRQKRCNHKKGGNGVAGVMSGQGDSPNYAIIRHTFANGDTWARCQRCGKTWKPPIRKRCKSQEEYDSLYALYELALQYPTTNIPSSSYVFKYSDNGEFYREATEFTTLR